MEYQKVIYYTQTDMQLTICEFKTKQEGISKSDMPFSNRYATYFLWFQNKTEKNIRTWCDIFKQTCNSLAVVPRQNSIGNQKVMYYIQTDMQLTPCDSKTKEDGISETNMPYSNRSATYPLLFQNKTIWIPDSDEPSWYSNRHATYMLQFQNNRMEYQKGMCHIQADMQPTCCSLKIFISHLLFSKSKSTCLLQS
jgi:hypothetical protein